MAVQQVAFPLSGTRVLDLILSLTSFTHFPSFFLFSFGLSGLLPPSQNIGELATKHCSYVYMSVWICLHSAV